jgi:hypothetical protein
LTLYATKNLFGIKGMSKVACFVVRKDDEFCWMLINNKRDIIFEANSIDSMAMKIDRLKDERNKKK